MKIRYRKKLPHKSSAPLVVIGAVLAAAMSKSNTIEKAAEFVESRTKRIKALESLIGTKFNGGVAKD